MRKPAKKKVKSTSEKQRRETRDFSQRAHDVVREVEKRHAERHKDEPTD